MSKAELFVMLASIQMAPARLLKDSAALLRQQAERIVELESECNQLRVNSERYNVLRCYELCGSWPNAFKAPAGLLAFSSCITQHELDKVLDDMLGYIPHPTPESVRSDYQQWIRENTLARIEQVKHNG